MKIAGSLWWWSDERLRDAGGIARESNRWAMEGRTRGVCDSPVDCRAGCEEEAMGADWKVHHGWLLAKSFQWWM